MAGVLAGVVLLPACAAESGEVPASPELLELERQVFVPAAAAYLTPFLRHPLNNCSVLRPIVMDQHEFTRGELVAAMERHAPGRHSLASQFGWRSGQPLRQKNDTDWPAFMTYHEAVEVAGWRGMRLPTPREWIHVAVGRRGIAYPWGKDQNSVANTVETGITHPTPVGTFENGRSVPFGCYDMLGNVWEWVDGRVPGYLDAGSSDERVSVMGGSFAARRRATFGVVRRDGSPTSLAFQALQKDPGTLSPEIGARMCADAETYLFAKAALWGRGDEVRERVRAVGRRWASDPVARSGLLGLLDELRARPAAPPALAWLGEGAQGDDDVREPR